MSIWTLDGVIVVSYIICYIQICLGIQPSSLRVSFARHAKKQPIDKYNARNSKTESEEELEAITIFNIISNVRNIP